MNESKAFCCECRKETTYTIQPVQLSATLKGEGYSYSGKVAHCDCCGSELYLDEVNDYNLKALYNQYREKQGLISLDTVLAIPKKYAIGKRPLSVLLGWGELTFSRYCSGDVPTRQYSEILQKIYDDPKYYEQILENGKGKFKSEMTYIKSRKALDNLLFKDCHENSKIDLAIEYLLDFCGDITPLALQKALYYIQGFYYAFYKTFLFSEDCQAWVHGPVYRDIYYRYREYKYDFITQNKVKASNNVTTLSSSEKAIFESVAKNICCYSGKVLEKFTHSEAPWLIARAGLADTEPSARTISKESIGTYFVSVKEKYNMITPSDIKEYAQVMFEQL